MKLVVINTVDTGGAANSCIRLHESLLHTRVSSKLLLLHKTKGIKCSYKFVAANKPVQSQPVQIPPISVRLKNKLYRIAREFKLVRDTPSTSQRVADTKENEFLKSRSPQLTMLSYPYSRFDITESPIYQQSDIINLHWVANFLDYPSFFEKNKKPVVWTLHDMSPFLGLEHYDEAFIGIDENGFPIDRIKTDAELEFFDSFLAEKKKIFSKIENLTIVAPSKWLAFEAEKSGVFQNSKIHHIPYGLDSEVFKERDRHFSRDMLGIPQDKKVILFVADSINNSRKGFAFLKRAFKKLNDPNLVLCAIGRKSVDLESLDNVIELGAIHDERFMSAAYSAADVFVIPSLMDNLPNTVLESIMCGTPVIGFPIGGIPDMIQNGENGYLTDDVSVSSLHETILKFIDTAHIFNRKTIRENATEQYSSQIQAKAYTALFDAIMNKN